MSLTQQQIAALESVGATLASIFGGPAVGAAVTAAESIGNTFIPAMNKAPTPPPPVVVATPVAPPLGTVPATDVQPPKADPTAHPVLAAQNLAALVPTPVQAGSVPPVDQMNLPDLYTRLTAVEQKLNAAIAAMGLQGSAAMAAHP